MEHNQLTNTSSQTSPLAVGGESGREKYKFLLALVLFGIFGTVIIVAIFKIEDSQIIVSISGIFSAWIGAIISFYFIEHQSSVRVLEAIQTRDLVRSDLQDEREARKKAEVDLPRLQEENSVATQEKSLMINRVNNLRIQLEEAQQALDEQLEDQIANGENVGEVLGED